MATGLVVQAATHDVLGHPAADPRLLTATERRRAEAFRQNRDRDDFVAAHLLIRAAAAFATGRRMAHIDFLQRCPRCGATGHGAPLLADGSGRLSMSHTRGSVAAAVADTTVGVDIEACADKVDVDLVAMTMLTEYERSFVLSAPQIDLAFFDIWVRKEVLVKSGRTELDQMGATDVTDVDRMLTTVPQQHRGRLLDLNSVSWSVHTRDGVLVGAAAVERGELDVIPWAAVAAHWADTQCR